MSSEVPQLTFDAIDEIFDGFEASGQPWSPQQFARAIEQAVRAQWAAEVESRERVIADLTRYCDTQREQLSDYLAMQSERDSAQAEAKAIKEKLQDSAIAFARAIEAANGISPAAELKKD